MSLYDEYLYCTNIWHNYERLTTNGVIHQPNAPPLDHPPPYTERWYPQKLWLADNELFQSPICWPLFLKKSTVMKSSSISKVNIQETSTMFPNLDVNFHEASMKFPNLKKLTFSWRPQFFPIWKLTFRRFFNLKVNFQEASTSANALSSSLGIYKADR